MSFVRDPRQLPTDAGHLALQELVLTCGRRNGYAGRFELATRPADPWRSIDVPLSSDARRLIIVVECWNLIGDIGASARSSSRKLHEAQDLAVAAWGSEGVARLVWVVRATRRNRMLLSTYPEVFRARFRGSSRQWVAALADGAPPPAEDGLVWAGAAAARLWEWRSAAP